MTKSSDALRRAIRTLLQFIVAGGLTTIVNELSNGLSPNNKVLVQGASMLVVTFAQNALEDSGKIPAVLKAQASSGENPVPDPEV